MTTIRKTALAAMAVAVIATSGVFAAPSASSAMTSVRVAPVETSVAKATQVGWRHHRRRHHHRRHRWGHGYRHCFWVKKRFWSDYYGYYIFKPVRVCR